MLSTEKIKDVHENKKLSVKRKVKKKLYTKKKS